MEDKLTNSELGPALSTVTDNTDLHKAWHLLSLILTNGRPVRPAALASRCTSFRSSNEYVEFMCSIPNSPIFLTENRFVILSSAAFVAFGQFMLNLNRILAFVPRIKIGFLEPKRVWEDVSKTYYRKRKRNGSNFEYFPVVKKRAFLQNVVDEEDEEQNMLSPSNKIQNAYAKVHFQVNMIRNMITPPVNSSVMSYSSDKFDKMTVITSSLIKSYVSLLSYGLKNSGQESQRETSEFVNREALECVSTSECQLGFLNHEKFPHVPHEIKVKCIETDMPHQEPSLLPSRMKNPVVLGEAMMSNPYSMCGIDLNEQYCPEVDEQMIMSPVEVDNTLYACKAIGERGEDERVREGKEEEQICDSGRCKGDVENLPNNTTNMNTPLEHDINIILRSNEMLPTFDREKTSHVKSWAVLSEDLLSVDKKQLEKSFPKWKMIQQEAQNPRLQSLSQWETIGNYKTNCAHTEQQHCKRDNSLISMKQNYEHKTHTEDIRANSKEIRGKTVSTILKNQVEPKLLPNFESFTVEEEEGSGGYGTVYRAQRKHDGVTLAIKCPHGNANRHHIQNEMKMLLRPRSDPIRVNFLIQIPFSTATKILI